MGKAFALIYVSTVTLALCCEAVSAKAVPQLHRYRHERSHRRYQHLQDLVDRLDLRQKTDHILITNLQEALKEVQERGADFTREKDMKKALKNEGATLHFEENRERERDTTIEANEQERRDEILLLRQEIAALRSEVRVLKAERAVESQHRSAHSLQQEHREALTASWVVENVRRLQDAVVELQEAINVTTALHEKQEVESRLLVVGRDLSALRSSLSSVTSKAEAAMATVETVREELVRTAKDSNHASGKVDELGLELSWMREEFNGLLSALPDGLTVRGLNTTTKDSIISSNEAAVDEKGSTPRDSGPSALLQKVKNAMQPLRDDLDSSVTALEHIRTAPQAPSPPKEGVQLEERVKATESGLGEVRASSIQLLEALETLETQVERGVAEVRQEVAKLEYKVTALQDCANDSEVPSNRAAIKALLNHMDQIENRLSAIQDIGKMTKVPSFHRKSDFIHLQA